MVHDIFTSLAVRQKYNVGVTAAWRGFALCGCFLVVNCAIRVFKLAHFIITVEYMRPCNLTPCSLIAISQLYGEAKVAVDRRETILKTTV